MEIILASQSPRRRELMHLMGIPYTAIVSDVEEVPPVGATPAELVKALALQKAQAVQRLRPKDCIIGADTVVYIDGRVIGKPHSKEEAKKTLTTLSGNTHTVFTGIAVLTPNGQDVRHSETVVTFCNMTEAEIDWYIATGEPMDKAGAYGIQGPGGMFVQKVNGNYFTVIGMDLPMLYDMLKCANVLTLGNTVQRLTQQRNGSL
ncbi:MAG: Maf family protein [Eubacteriales bacterium]|nr:Maf family protein [Eubacteriales bacterium]